MLKWVGGCLLLLVLVVGGGMWWGYQTMQGSLNEDGSARVMIGAAPSRVFASMAHGDSVATWMAQGNTVLSSRHGPLVPGDSLKIEMRKTIGVPLRAMVWRVRQVVPDRLLVLDLVADTAHMIAATRRDSLSAIGDSTSVVSRVTSAMLDSVKSSRAVPGRKKDDVTTGFSSDLLLSMFRMQSKLELLNLKARIEGTPGPKRR